ncbi:hypothetical protein R1flu_017816 [Riccia fluitans]|uniref:HhH-GPD domain-containing protein n=1 Tax=Riccia fluitans TaxID=41844 RepID=A0ABD1ZE18_9MARC
MSSSGKGETVPGLLDGKISFRARKLVWESSSKQAVEAASSLDGSDNQPEILYPDAVPLRENEENGCVGGESATEKIRCRRSPSSRKRVKSTITYSEERRVTRSRTAASAAKVSSDEQPATSVSVAEKLSVDFWHSSLSENTDHVAVNGPSVLGLPRKSMLASEDVLAAIQHLKSADSRLRAVIEMHEGPKFERCSSAFTALVRSIVFQQLATKAASTIFGRVVDLCGGLGKVEPVTIAGLSKEQLRGAGLSERKASYVHDLAAHFLTGNLSDVSINEMDDENLTKALTAVRGIGVWSVHMFMLFSLHRPDVLPVGDLGVRKGFQKLYQLKSLPSPAEMENLSSSWQPYRSIGSWYMWRVLNMTLPF